MSEDRQQKRSGGPRVSKGPADPSTKDKGSRKGAKRRSVRSPRVSKGKASAHAPPHDFSPALGDVDLHLFGEGKHLRIYEKLGAHVMTHEGKSGVAFAVWAPNAERVSVVGNFNEWDGSKQPMRPLDASGIWELFVPGVKPGEL